MTKHSTLIAALLAACSWMTACTAPVGSTISVPSDAAQTCAEHCQSIGLRLSAVAIMANNVGCVCQARAASPEGPNAANESATTTAGMATIFMQEAEAQRARNQQAQQSMSTPK